MAKCETSLLSDYTPFIIPNSAARVYRGHNANIKSAKFAGEDGRFVVTGSRWDSSRSAPCTLIMATSDNTVRIWEMGGTCLSVLRGHTSRIWEVDATQSGERIASASGDKTIRVWAWKHEEDRDLQECRQVLRGNTGDVYSARWHPLGNHIAAGGYDKIVRLYDVEGGNVIKTFTGERCFIKYEIRRTERLAGHALSISSLVFNPMGNLIISG